MKVAITVIFALAVLLAGLGAYAIHAGYLSNEFTVVGVVPILLGALLAIVALALCLCEFLRS